MQLCSAGVFIFLLFNFILKYIHLLLFTFFTFKCIWMLPDIYVLITVLNTQSCLLFFQIFWNSNENSSKCPEFFWDLWLNGKYKIFVKKLYYSWNIAKWVIKVMHICKKKVNCVTLDSLRVVTCLRMWVVCKVII